MLQMDRDAYDNAVGCVFNFYAWIVQKYDVRIGSYEVCELYVVLRAMTVAGYRYRIDLMYKSFQLGCCFYQCKEHSTLLATVYNNKACNFILSVMLLLSCHIVGIVLYTF